MPEQRDHCGFVPSVEVHRPGELIGRNKPGRELDSLLTSVALNHCNPQVVAERRSGKSSLFNCAQSRLRSQEFGSNFVSPIVNFKKHAVSSDVKMSYALLCSSLLMECATYSVWTHDSRFEVNSNRSLRRCESIDEYIALIIASDWKTERLFEAIVARLAKLGYSTILFVDEYEAMFFMAFGARLGSAHTLRDLATSSLENDQRFQCAIAGARPWDFYAQDVGSDDFNFIDDHLFLKPLTEEECKAVLVTGHEHSSGKPKANIQPWVERSEELAKYAGNWPYTLIVTANQIAKSGTFDSVATRARLSSHFSNHWNRLPPEYKSVLKGHRAVPRIQRDLVNWGLAEFNNIGTIVPSGLLWEEFVNEIGPDQDGQPFPSSITDSRELEAHQLGGETTDLITQVNETLYGKNLPVVFDTTISMAYPKQFRNVGVRVRDENGFKIFISAIYLILFESTQNKVGGTKKKEKLINLARIPEPFSRKHSREPDVFHRIDMLRHKFIGAHDTASKNFVVRRFTAEKCQEHYVGHRNRPTDDDFYAMQVGILKEFNLFLIDLLKWAESQLPKP